MRRKERYVGWDRELRGALNLDETWRRRYPGLLRCGVVAVTSAEARSANCRTR